MSRTPQGFGDVLGEEVFTPQRMSVMAILSLVFGILCVPGFGVLGLIFGAAALFAIHGSRGRLGGTGVAVAGLIVSIIACAAWIVVGVAAMQVKTLFEQKALEPVATAAAAIEKGDMAGARALFTAEANAAITDEQIAAFRTAYQAQLGSFKSMPRGVVDLLMAYGQLGQAMQAFQGRQHMVPLPAEYDQGMAIFVVQVPSSFDTGQRGQSTPGGIPARNFGVITVDGKEIWLVDPNAPLPASPPAPPPAAPPGG